MDEIKNNSMTSEEMAHQANESALQRNHDFRMFLTLWIGVAFVCIFIAFGLAMASVRSVKELQVQQDYELEKMKFRCASPPSASSSPYPPITIWPPR